MKHLTAFLALFLLLLPACRESQPAADPEDEGLIAVYAETLVLNEQFKATPSAIDSAEYQQRLQQILATHGFTKEEFYRLVESNLQSAERYRLFHDRLNVKLEQRKSKS